MSNTISKSIGIVKIVFGGIQFLLAVLVAIEAVSAFITFQQSTPDTYSFIGALFSLLAPIFWSLLIAAMVFLSVVFVFLGVCDLLCGIFVVKKIAPTVGIVFSCINEAVMCVAFFEIVINQIDDALSASDFAALSKVLPNVITTYSISITIFSLVTAVNVLAFLSLRFIARSKKKVQGNLP